MSPPDGGLTRLCRFEGCGAATWHPRSPYCLPHRDEMRARTARAYQARRRLLDGKKKRQAPSLCLRCNTRPPTGAGHGGLYCDECRKPARREWERARQQAIRAVIAGRVRVVLNYVVAELDKMRLGVIPINNQRLTHLGALLTQIKGDPAAHPDLTKSNPPKHGRNT